MSDNLGGHTPQFPVQSQKRRGGGEREHGKFSS